MAIYHFHAKIGSRSKGQSAAAKYAYVCRIGKYAETKSRVLDKEIVHSNSFNMPAWASDNAEIYWKAADENERVNGRLFLSMDFALPKELDRNRQIELAEKFAGELAHTADGVLPYTVAVHRGKGENPHVHLMVNERVNDGYARSPESWFRRAAVVGKQAPELGGARKTEALKSTEWLEEVRGLWAERANEALARAGEEARIDHRSHAERGLEILPTVHEGPTARAMAERDKIVERVQLNRDVKAANAELLQLENERGQVAQAIERLLAKARETIEKLSQRAQSVFVGGPAPVFARVRRAAPGPEESEAAEKTGRILGMIDRLATRAQGAAWIDGQVAEREREIELAVRRSAQYQSGRALFESETSIDDGGFRVPNGELLARFGGLRQSSRNEAARAEKKIADHPETQSRLHRFLREPDPVLKQWRVDADRARGYEREYAQKYDRIEAQWTGHEEEWNAAAVARRDAGEKQIEKWRREIDDLKDAREPVLRELARRDADPRIQAERETLRQQQKQKELQKQRKGKDFEMEW